MTRIEAKVNDLVGVERFSRRIVHGVEILERETIRKIKVNADSDMISKTIKTPRLVISDAVNRSKLLITKSRAQLGDIDALLRNIIRRPLNVK